MGAAADLSIRITLGTAAGTRALAAAVAAAVVDGVDDDGRASEVRSGRWWFW